MSKNIIALLFFTVFLTVFCPACNNRPKLKRPEGMPELQSCSVTVTFGGNPKEGVLVTLMPEGGSKWKPSGTTDSDGTAIPDASFGFKGAPTGKYTVTFTCITDNPNYDEKKTNSRRFLSLIPLKYGQGKSTETVEVKAGDKNNFSFALDAGEEMKK
jgi:5-hydroxyisourate hydrolase-like protein (transthyretin family)